MATNFKQVQNNSRSLVATAPSPATSGTSLVVTAATGADFPAPGNGFWATIWDAALYADPTNDPAMEIVLVTARSTDTLTITRAQQGTAARTVAVGDAIALLWTASNVTDMTGAINTAETAITSKFWDAVVAASGGDYTDLGSALTAGAKRILVKGSITQGAALTISQTDVYIEGNGAAIITIGNTTNTITSSGARNVINGIQFDINSTSDLASNDTGFVTITGAYSVLSNCYFDLAGVTTATVGCVVKIGSNSNIYVHNNKFVGGNGLRFILNTFASNRKVIVSNNLFEGFTDMTAIGVVTTAADLKVDILNNHISPSTMAASKNLIHYETTSTGVIQANIIGNTIHAIGTYANTNHTAIYIKAASTSVEHFANIVGNVCRLNTANSSYGITIDTFTRANISGNAVGYIEFNGLIRSNISGNRVVTSILNTSTTANLGVNITGNWVSTINLDRMSGGSISHNTTESGASGTFTLGNTSSLTAQLSIIGNSQYSSYDIAGAYHTIIGNIGAGGTGSPTGTLTLAGSNHKLSGNHVATLSSSATDTEINGVLTTKSSTTSTAANTTETDLFTYTTGASRLARNGDFVRMEFSATTAANANTKQFKLYWAGTAVLDTTALVLNAASITGYIDVLRTGATTQVVTCHIESGDALLVSKTVIGAGTATLSGTNIIKVTGTNGTANATDISLVQGRVTFVPVV